MGRKFTLVGLISSIADSDKPPFFIKTNFDETNNVYRWDGNQYVLVSENSWTLFDSVCDWAMNKRIKDLYYEPAFEVIDTVDLTNWEVELLEMYIRVINMSWPKSPVSIVRRFKCIDVYNVDARNDEQEWYFKYPEGSFKAMEQGRVYSPEELGLFICDEEIR